MKKIPKMNEAAWVLGVLLCTLGIALCTKASFGLSMIAAPPYIIHVKMIQFFPWYTQGTSEYIFQGLLLILICVICQRFRVKYLFSFVTAVVSGLTLDLWFLILGGNAPLSSMPARIVFFIFGELLTTAAIALYFRTSLPLQVYELLVTEVSSKFNIDVNKMKMINDVSYLVLSCALAFILTRSFTGIGIGTVVITLVNAPLITFFGKILDKFFTFDSLFEKHN